MTSGVGIAVAIVAMNVTTYAYTMVAARVLGPSDFGAFAAAMATLLVAGVLQLGLQATGARRISSGVAPVADVEHEVLRVAARVAVVAGTALLLASPLVARVLRLHDTSTAALIAVTVALMTFGGGQAGVLQGERRWPELAAVFVAMGVPRLIIGVPLMLWWPSEVAALLGVTLGSIAPVLVAAWVLARGQRPEVEADPEAASAPTRSVVRESAVNAQALLAFFALSNLDVIVARNVLDGRDAGLYAGGLILTKAVLFLPQFVVVLAFPSLSTSGERARALTRGLTLVLGLGVVATLGALVLPDLALIFIGGEEYAAVRGRLWLFALLGTALATLQLLVYSVLARQGRRSLIAVWVGILAMIALGARADSVGALLSIVATVDGILATLLVAIAVWVTRRGAAPTTTAAPTAG